MPLSRSIGHGNGSLDAADGPSRVEDLATRRCLERWLYSIPEGSQLLSMDHQDAPEGASGVERDFELHPAIRRQLLEAVALSIEQVGQPGSAEHREEE